MKSMFHIMNGQVFFNFPAIYALIKRELKRSMRFFGFELLTPALMALLFLLVFRLALGEEAFTTSAMGYQNIEILRYIASGFVGLAIMQFCFYACGYSLMFDKMESILDDLLRAPLSGLDIVAGYVSAAIMRGMVAALSVWVVLSFFMDLRPQSLLLLIFFLFAGALTLSAFSLIAAIFSQKWDSLAAKEAFFAVPLLQLSGAFFPLSAIQGEFWRTLMSLNPFYYVIDGVRFSITGISEAGMITAIFVTLLICACTVAIASWLFSTGYHIKE